ncbi:MAG: undecaprenyl-diphosphate phosphatase [Methanobacteriota archaeon]|nr:MAG: undecaprenyl-diphosphate phosphatase [Euryarchaeota archaeon]
MNLLEGLFLGVLQGITEWLPVSSSGQSMLFLINVLHISPEEAFSISATLHLGSLFAVLYYFRRRLSEIFRGDRELLRFLVIATVASGAVGLPAYLLLKGLFTSASGEAVTMFIGVMLIITGMVLKNTGKTARREVGAKEAALAGGAQGFSVLPGISRSGTTIAALLLQGVEQETALYLSFLLAIPAIAGLVAIESGQRMVNAPVALGVASSFLVSLVTMHYFIGLAKRIDFSNFCIAVGSLAFFIPLLIMAAETLL